MEMTLPEIPGVEVVRARASLLPQATSILCAMCALQSAFRNVEDLVLGQTFLDAADSRNCTSDGLEYRGDRFVPMPDWALGRPELDALAKRWEEMGLTAPDRADITEFYGREVNSGELACFASHRAAWAEAAALAEGEFLMVLEDDVTPLPALSRWCPVPRRGRARASAAPLSAAAVRAGT